MQTQDSDSGMCMMKGCTEVDLLPARCSKCHRIYCSSHLPLAAHQCSKAQNVVVPVCPLCNTPVPLEAGDTPDRAVSRHIDRGCTSSTALERLNFCSYQGCRTNELSLLVCERCGNSFCVQHLLPEKHRCRLAPAKERSQQRLNCGQAQSSLMSPFVNTRTQPFGQPESASSIVLRVFFAREFSTPPCWFRFSLHCVVGRALDIICEKCDIKTDYCQPSTAAKETAQGIWVFSLAIREPLPPSLELGDIFKECDAILISRGTSIDQPTSEQIQKMMKQIS